MEWLKKNPKGIERDRAMFILAQYYFRNNDRLWCFYQCDEILENYPDSRLFFQVLELQFKVADAFLTGYKKRILGLPILSMEDAALEMLFRIQAATGFADL